MGSSSQQDPIVIETGKYNRIVNNIEKNSKDLLKKKEYVEYGDNCHKNDVIPTYTTNYEKALDAIKGIMEVDTIVVKLMRTVRDDYLGIDSAASYGCGTDDEG